MKSLGDRIRSQLAKLDMSQAELARRVKVTQPAINGLVNGKSTSSAHLHRIARELQTTVAYLTGETDDPTSDQPDDQFTSQDRDDLALLQQLTRRDRDAIRQILRTMTGEHSEPAPAPLPTVPAATLHSPPRKFATGS